MTGRVLCGDAADLLPDVPDESIDVIFTDPPYAAEFLPCYQILADHAARVLKPSGHLVTYSGQYYLDRVMRILGTADLEWVWMVGQINTLATFAWPRNVLSSWKPILIWQKPPATKFPRQLGDIVGGKWLPKKHPWEQCVANTIQLLGRLAGPGAQVIDPFCGTGVNLLSAKLLYMDYLGFEIDPATFAMAVSRIEQEPLAGRAVQEIDT